MASEKVVRHLTAKEGDWNVVEQTPDGHLLLTIHNNAITTIAMTHHAAAMFACDILEAVDPKKAQITFREAVEQSPDMTPEQKAYWLSVCDEEGL